jgi:hypothetical protein
MNCSEQKMQDNKAMREELAELKRPIDCQQAEIQTDEE